MKKTNNAGTGLEPDQANEVRHFFSPVPNLNCECRNANASVSLLDADAQLCLLGTGNAHFPNTWPWQLRVKNISPMLIPLMKKKTFQT